MRKIKDRKFLNKKRKKIKKHQKMNQKKNKEKKKRKKKKKKLLIMKRNQSLIQIVLPLVKIKKVKK